MNNKKVKIIPLGGLEQIGMNMTAFEYGSTIIVVDCGLAFPDDSMLGIDLVIPDITYLKQNKEKVKGYIITHGHEDHIGALPYVLKDVNAPIYATKLTMGIISRKFEEHEDLPEVEKHVMKYGDTATFGDFTVEFIRTNHSIADAAALAIHSPAGTIVHTGDFKVDYTPVFGDPIDLPRLAELGREGVLALMCDSTNVTKSGFTMSEKTVGKTIEGIFADNTRSRIIVATFASNVDRVQQIVNSAVKFGRKVVIEGRSMVNIISTANDLGYIQIPENTLIDISMINSFPDDRLVIITTGSQGETMAALSRMAASIHKKVTIKPGDVIILSSNPIPGNEKAVSKVINELSMKGANVIFQDTHVSGHACEEEIKLIYTLTKPEYAIPVHGEYRHLKHHAELAARLGIPNENIFLLSSGDVLSVGEDGAKVTGRVPSGSVMVDGLGVGDVGNVVLRDRQNLSENGVVIVAMTLQEDTTELIAGPEIITRGLVYVRESEQFINEAKDYLFDVVMDCTSKPGIERNRIKNIVKDELGDFIWRKINRSPVIIPVIMEV